MFKFYGGHSTTFDEIRSIFKKFENCERLYRDSKLIPMHGLNSMSMMQPGVPMMMPQMQMPAYSQPPVTQPT